MYGARALVRVPVVVPVPVVVVVVEVVAVMVVIVRLRELSRPVPGDLLTQPGGHRASLRIQPQREELHGTAAALVQTG